MFPDTVSGKQLLIINADDFGYTRGINRGIARCHRDGVVTSTTLMANGEAFEDALAMVKDLPDLGVGVHLVLTELQSVAPSGMLPGLVDRQGMLPATPGRLFQGVLGGAISIRVLTIELERQVEKIMNRGLVPTHLDAHKHVHVLPAILEAVIRVACRYGIRWIRNPFDETSLVRSFLTVANRHRLGLGKQYLRTRMFSVLRSTFEHRLRKAGLRCPDHFFGTITTGIWNEASLRLMVDRLPLGINELMTHPGECDRDLRRHGTRLRESREQEQKLLLSPAFKEYLRREQITLTHYGDHAR